MLYRTDRCNRIVADHGLGDHYAGLGGGRGRSLGQPRPASLGQDDGGMFFTYGNAGGARPLSLRECVDLCRSWYPKGGSNYNSCVATCVDVAYPKASAQASAQRQKLPNVPAASNVASYYGGQAGGYGCPPTGVSCSWNGSACICENYGTVPALCCRGGSGANAAGGGGYNTGFNF